MTPKSSGYLENIWAWTADHDLDITSQDQIDNYAARGILVESTGPSWLWGTASEHNVLYQYTLSAAKNVFMGMIQTESPYFQSTPAAPAPFTPGLFPNDPRFVDCNSTMSNSCAVSWALRIIDSSATYIYGAGLYSWFSSYSQDCLATENCQSKGLEVQRSSDVWLYNLATKAIVEMVSPTGEEPTYARDNQNGFLSSIMAWLKGSIEVSGPTNFTGFALFEQDSLSENGLSSSCEAAMYQKINCDDIVHTFGYKSYYGTVGNKSTVDSVCADSCMADLLNFRQSINVACSSTPDFAPGIPLVAFIDSIWSGWNETCLLDTATREYCNDIIDSWPELGDNENLPASQACSYCYLTKLAMMQTNPYSGYDKEYFQPRYEYASQLCEKPIGELDPSPPIIHPIVDSPNSTCTSGNYHIVASGDTCDSIAIKNSVSSGGLFAVNPELLDCSKPTIGMKLCLPFSCQTYAIQPDDDCISISLDNHVRGLSIFDYNPMLSDNCTNLIGANPSWGSTLCITPPGGTWVGKGTNGTKPGAWKGGDGYSDTIVQQPTGAVLAEGTTPYCGSFYQFTAGSACAEICLANSIPNGLFLEVNPSLSKSTCDSDLFDSMYYCVAPYYGWREMELVSGVATTTTALTSSSSTATTTASTSTACKTVSGIVSPTPSSAVCGHKGTSYAKAGTGTIIAYGSTTPYVASLAACSARCLATSCCSSFYFIQGTSCNLKFGSRAFNENLAAPGGILFDFYEASCFTCGALSCTS